MVHQGQDESDDEHGHRVGHGLVEAADQEEAQRAYEQRSAKIHALLVRVRLVVLLVVAALVRTRRAEQSMLADDYAAFDDASDEL